jgi:Polyketide cyclase / dehydrase and lipid transport
MTVVHSSRDIPASPGEAWWLLGAVDRWETYVEGFAALVRSEGQWPAAGALVEWDSTPRGRGRVSERVVSCRAQSELVIELAEQRLSATKRVLVGPVDDGVRVSFELDYRLNGPAWQRLIVDPLFVRRALRDSLERELDGFAAELRALADICR